MITDRVCMNMFASVCEDDMDMDGLSSFSISCPMPSSITKTLSSAFRSGWRRKKRETKRGMNNGIETNP